LYPFSVNDAPTCEKLGSPSIVRTVAFAAVGNKKGKIARLTKRPIPAILGAAIEIFIFNAPLNATRD
jgi:hypothetical protein